ncbi:MAG TPA: DNA mismatch repair protein MutL, partial [Puia sp.]|nr:DNA mismatch repair protein MutL [Puia sp.]
AVAKPFTDQKRAEITSSGLYQTFTQKNQAHLVEPSQNSELRHWKNEHSAEKGFEIERSLTGSAATMPWQDEQHLAFRADLPVTQLLNTYLVFSTNRGFILVHQQSAHERILFEKYMAALNGKKTPVQHSLFPITIQLAAADAILLHELIPDLHDLGYLVEPFGKDSFIIQGSPADLEQGKEKMVLEAVLEQFKHFSNNKMLSPREKLIRSLAGQRAIKPGRTLLDDEMVKLLEALFACDQPNISPDGKPTYFEFSPEQLQKIFGR